MLRHRSQHACPTTPVTRSRVRSEAQMSRCPPCTTAAPEAAWTCHVFLARSFDIGRSPVTHVFARLRALIVDRALEARQTAGLADVDGQGEEVARVHRVCA